MLSTEHILHYAHYEGVGVPQQFFLVLNAQDSFMRQNTFASSETELFF